MVSKISNHEILSIVGQSKCKIFHYEKCMAFMIVLAYWKMNEIWQNENGLKKKNEKEKEGPTKLIFNGLILPKRSSPFQTIISLYQWICLRVAILKFSITFISVIVTFMDSYFSYLINDHLWRFLLTYWPLEDHNIFATLVNL